MAALLMVLIVAMASATFIENDFGSQVARSRVYQTFWFESLFVLLALNLLTRMIYLKLYRIRKLPVFLFHAAFVLMIVGAGITRYTGVEGIMHIREGQSARTVQTDENVLTIILENETEILSEASYPFLPGLSQTFKKEQDARGETVLTELTHFFPHAYKQVAPGSDKKKVIGFVVSGASFRGYDYLQEGETRTYGSQTLTFATNDSADYRIRASGDSLFLRSRHKIEIKNMGDTLGYPILGEVFLEAKKVYVLRDFNLVFQEYFPSASLEPIPISPGEDPSAGLAALIFRISSGSDTARVVLWENEWDAAPHRISLGALKVSLGLGAGSFDLPFRLHLDDFRIDRYPGSMSPSSFSSFVQIIEPEKAPHPFHIYMNNILKYRGYRFFQSSYDPDEQGTILSVNYDVWGTTLTYISYLLLVLGIVGALLSPGSFFRKPQAGNILRLLVVGFFLLGALPSVADKPSEKREYIAVSAAHAREFGTLMVQNQQGRTEPFFTYSSELVRKIARKDKIAGLTPVQLFLEMNLNPSYWSQQPLIRISNIELQRYLGLSGKYASYTDLITPGAGYRLQGMVQTIYARPPAQRSKFDKAVLKTDEKVNICYSIFSGSYLKALPVPGDTDNTHWYVPSEAASRATHSEDSLYLADAFPAYFNELQKAKNSGDYSVADRFLQGLISFQQQHAGYELPGDFRKNIEIAYYTYHPFKKLFPYFFTLGLVLLIIQLTLIVAGKSLSQWARRIFFFLFLAGFVVQTLGIAARWFISGHAPMSNGYESMLFIAWITVLAGFLFHRRSVFALPATAVLAGLSLLVANLSFMDPEITNLVPVLQSYWLTIHVSVITASYGFLGLGAILGLIVHLLIVLRTGANHAHVRRSILNLTLLNHQTLIAGLYLLTIGTFLGAVWANESWGRYWGWDPKETWALISILVYTLVTHARMIPGMRGIFVFNVLSVFGFASILMTYFGVNYYLSGLHSYAGGDPVPVPVFVYYAVSATIVLSIGASVKFSKHFREQAL